ncbi:MAG TPA: DUF2007 domain-containing protein [Chryseosolibacter sp.]|jgi:hypothetical protein
MVEKNKDIKDDIIVLQHFDNAIDANIAKTKLDAYGIPCFLTEENMANLYPGQSLYAFKVRLHLFASDRDRAVQILEGDTLSVQDEGSVVCPRCHSSQVAREFPKKVSDSLTYVLFGVFLPHKKVNQCRDCGCEF